MLSVYRIVSQQGSRNLRTTPYVCKQSTVRVYDINFRVKIFSLSSKRIYQARAILFSLISNKNTRFITQENEFPFL